MEFIPIAAMILMVGVFGYFAVSIIHYHIKQKKESRSEAGEWDSSANVRHVAPIHEEVEHVLEITRARTGEDVQDEFAPLIDLLAKWEGKRNALPYDGQQAYYTAHEECRIDLASAIHDMILERTNG